MIPYINVIGYNEILLLPFFITIIIYVRLFDKYIFFFSTSDLTKCGLTRKLEIAKLLISKRCGDEKFETKPSNLIIFEGRAEYTHRQKKPVPSGVNLQTFDCRPELQPAGHYYLF